MRDKKPSIGPEAEMLARLQAMTEAIRKLRGEFQSTMRQRKPGRERATASDKPRLGRSADSRDD